MLMFSFAIPCKARGMQSKQLHFIIFGLYRFIPAYKAGLSRHLPTKRFRCEAHKYESMRRSYWCVAMSEDAVQRSRWTFCEVVKHLAHIQEEAQELINAAFGSAGRTA